MLKAACLSLRQALLSLYNRQYRLADFLTKRNEAKLFVSCPRELRQKELR